MKSPVPHNDPLLGQILLQSSFGSCLTRMAMDALRIVESGTWKGLGSTLCLHAGMVKPEQRLWTIEQDEKAWAEARSNYDDPRITFIHGRTLQVLDQLPEEIDLLVLDGGIEDSFEEWRALSQRSAVVAMDDICEDKNWPAFNEALRRGWKALQGFTTERNGWAILQRP